MRKPKKETSDIVIEVRPTRQRAQHSLGIEENRKSIYVMQPIDWLYAHGLLGKKGTDEAIARKEAGEFFVRLYTYAVEFSARPAMVDWQRIMVGGGRSDQPPEGQEERAIWLMAKKRQYHRIMKELRIKTKFGAFATMILVELCGEGKKFKDISKKHGVPIGLPSHVLNITLDDLREIAELR